MVSMLTPAPARPPCPGNTGDAGASGGHPSPGSETSAAADHTAAPVRLALSGPRPGWFALCLVLLLLAALLSLLIGSRTIDPQTSLTALFGGRGEDPDSQVIWDLRVPRTLLGIAVGAALAVAGALIQALTRNPLADPGILGVNAGAAFAVVLGTLALGAITIAGSIWWALIGAGVTTAAVYFLSFSGRGRGADPATLVLGGMALGAVLQGISTGLSLVFPEVFNGMRVWTTGHLSDRPLGMMAPVLPFLALGLVIAALTAGALNALALGDDAAKALGVPVTAVRVGVIVAVTLLCGTATALAGPVGFVGLMIPHVVRWCFGVDQRWILAFSVVLGPVLLLGADIVGRVILPGSEIPAGLITAVLGAPLLIVLARRKNASTL